MRRAIIGLLLYSGTAHADVYKCITQGKPAYQERPCEGSGTVLPANSSPADAMVGCWSVIGHVGKRIPSTYAVARAGNGRFELLNMAGKFLYAMKRATHDELDALKEMFRDTDFRDGLSVDWDETAKRQEPGDRWPPTMRRLPIGLYRVTERDGNMTYRFFMLEHLMLQDLPLSKKVSCAYSR